MDKIKLEVSVLVLGQMMKSNCYNEVTPQDMCVEAVEMADYIVEALKTITKNK